EDAACSAPLSDAVSYIDVAQLRGDLPADLRRRDFTIDALAVSLGDATRDCGTPVIDICGGLRDLAARVVRMNVPEVFAADPLRTMRAVRIATELGFTVEPATTEAMRQAASQ